MSVNEYSRTKRPYPLGLSLANHWQQQAGVHSTDPAITAAGALHSRLIAGWDNIAEMDDHKNPKDTPVMHAEKRSKLALAFVKRLATDGDHVLKAIAARRAGIRADINSRLDIRERSTGPELRSVLRGLDAEQRGNVIRRAIDDCDSELLSAVLLGHPTLLNMTHEQVANYRENAVTRHAGDLLTLDKTLQAAQKVLTDSFIISLDIAENSGASRAEQQAISAAETIQQKFEEILK